MVPVHSNPSWGRGSAPMEPGETQERSDFLPGRDRNRARPCEAGTLIPIKMSPSPYCPGPVLKNRTDDFATPGEASDLSFCFASWRSSHGPRTPATSPPAAPGRPAGDTAPTSINVAPLSFANSSLSANGITSSARLCRITVPGFTVLAVPYFFQAGQSRTSFASPLSMFMATAPPRLESDDDLGLVLVELGLGDADGFGEVVVGKRRVETSWPWSFRYVGLTPPGPSASRGGRGFSWVGTSNPSARR